MPPSLENVTALQTEDGAVSGRNRAEVASFKVEFGGRFVARSGTTSDENVVHNVDLLGSFLSALNPDETLAIEIDYDASVPRLSVGLRGEASGATAQDVELRRLMLSASLAALTSGQMPGFRYRSTDKFESRALPLATITVLKPRGRSPGRKRGAPGPTSTSAPAPSVLLPPTGLSADRFGAAIGLIRARGESAKLTLSMRLVRFDAATLRSLIDARDEAQEAEHKTQMDALRHLAETISDDALMTALLDDQCGVEVTLEVASAEPLDDSIQRMLCHAIFGVEPVQATPIQKTEIDLSSTYPRGYALSRLVRGLASSALIALRRVPEVYEASGAGGGCILGHTVDQQVVEIIERDRARHTYVIGSIGTGKSTLLLNMMRADMEAGRAVLLLDPHGDLWEEAQRLVPADRKKDLILVDLGNPSLPFHMNILEGFGGDCAVEQTATVNGLLRLFKNSMWGGLQEAFGPMFEMYFRNTLLLLMNVGGDEASILNFERVFVDEKYRRSLLVRCTDDDVKRFWVKSASGASSDHSLENLTPYVISKVSPFINNALLRPVLGSPTSSFDFVDVMGQQKIMLINLAKGVVGEGNSRLMGGLLTMRMVAAAQTQLTVPVADRKQLTVYMDEFQTYATEYLSEGIEECRKYGVRLVLANQSLGQINGSGNRANIGSSILANIATLISFRLGVEDASILANWFAPAFSAEDIMYLPDYTAVGRLLANGRALRPLEFRTLPAPLPA
jgi:Type IV secretion-system coupling protein DNA-binding domain/TraM recognition site of TraD and TraG